tara:strand:- start:40 stop:585 length:546 start_codon:yes stop_codon:yes gene_type:complete
MRITKVTTKTGDAGQTSLGTGQIVKKDHPRVNVLGEFDHLNSIIGWAVSVCPSDQLALDLKNIQQDIFNISADMSLPERKINLLKNERIAELEKHIDKMTDILPPLKEFILPGGSEFVSRLHIIRTSCRNAERSMVTMFDNDCSENAHLKYINRLSDYLFLLARLAKHNEGSKEEFWVFEK